MTPNEIEQLQNICKILAQLKSQLIEKLPHYGNESLFMQNDELTTGQLNNKTEIKIHLLTGQLSYYHNEYCDIIDATKDDFG